MKVAVLSTCSRNAGGLFYSVRWLSKALQTEGCHPEIFSPEDDYSQKDLPVWEPLSVHLYSAVGPLQSSWTLRRPLAEFKPDLIHLHGIWMDNQWAAYHVQKKHGFPVVVSPRGMLDPWAVSNAGWKKRIVEKLFARKALEQATCIHALCRSEAESIRAYGLKNPIAIIPNGVELPRLDTTNSKPQTSNRKKHLLFLGRIHPKKGLKELIEAWGWPDATWREEWQLLIAGWDDGGHLNGLKKQASQIGLSWADATSDLRPLTSDLCFLGPKFGEEKEALLRSVDAFILPSFSEGLPMSVLEAWAYGLPVIMTDFCNLPEGFSAGAGVRVEPNADSIMQGLDRLSSMTDNQLKTLGANGRSLVERSFTWAIIAKQMHRVYEWCLTDRNPPDCMEFYRTND